MNEHSALLEPLDALAAMAATGLSIPASWVEVCPYLFEALEGVSIQALIYEWIPGPMTHRKTRQSFRVSLQSPSGDELMERLAGVLESHEHRLQRTEQSLLALRLDRAVTCERDGDLLTVDMYRKAEITQDAVMAAVVRIEAARPVAGLCEYLRVRELICTRSVEGPLQLRLRAYRKVECIGEDDAWLAANGFTAHPAEPSLLEHVDSAGVWIFWQGENVAIFVGTPPEGYELP